MNARLTAIERNGIKLKPKTMKNLITPFFIHYSYFFKIGNKFQNTTNFNRTKKYFQKNWSLNRSPIKIRRKINKFQDTIILNYSKEIFYKN